MDEETQKKVISFCENLIKKGEKLGKGQSKDESKSENFKNAIRIAGSAAKSVEDGKSSATVEKLGKVVQGKFGYGRVPTRADIESIAKMSIQVALGMPLPEKKAKTKEENPKITA